MLIVTAVFVSNSAVEETKIGHVRPGERVDVFQFEGGLTSDLRCDLTAFYDLDLELWDRETKVCVVGRGRECTISNLYATTNPVEYKGDLIGSSGYQGGKEVFEIKGTLSNSYEVKVYGYQEGDYEVTCSHSSRGIIWGEVKDVADRPLEAKISVYKRDSRTPERELTTDKDGAFSTVVLEGEYYLIVAPTNETYGTKRVPDGEGILIVKGGRIKYVPVRFGSPPPCPREFPGQVINKYDGYLNKDEIEKVITRIYPRTANWVLTLSLPRGLPLCSPSADLDLELWTRGSKLIGYGGTILRCNKGGCSDAYGGDDLYYSGYDGNNELIEIKGGVDNEYTVKVTGIRVQCTVNFTVDYKYCAER